MTTEKTAEDAWRSGAFWGNLILVHICVFHDAWWTAGVWSIFLVITVLCIINRALKP